MPPRMTRLRALAAASALLSRAPFDPLPAEVDFHVSWAQ